MQSKAHGASDRQLGSSFSCDFKSNSKKALPLMRFYVRGILPPDVHRRTTTGQVKMGKGLAFPTSYIFLAKNAARIHLDLLAGFRLALMV